MVSYLSCPFPTQSGTKSQTFPGARDTPSSFNAPMVAMVDKNTASIKSAIPMFINMLTSVSTCFPHRLTTTPMIKTWTLTQTSQLNKRLLFPTWKNQYPSEKLTAGTWKWWISNQESPLFSALQPLVFGGCMMKKKLGRFTFSLQAFSCGWHSANGAVWLPLVHNHIWQLRRASFQMSTYTHTNTIHVGIYLPTWMVDSYSKYR